MNPNSWGNGPSGARHYRWSGGSVISSHGYVKLRVIGHPNADRNGYVYGHLLAWLNAGNPPPADDEVIHHINGNKRDNRIENLRLEKRYNHSVGHHRTVSDQTVRMIRESYAAGAMDMPALAKKFRVSIARVSKFIRGETRLPAGGPVSTHNRGKSAAGRLLDGVEHNEFPGGAS